MRKIGQPIVDHFENVLDMVAIGAGSDQPYEQFIGLSATLSQPVTICRKFKGEDKLSPPLPQTLDSARRKSRRARPEWPRRGH